MSGSWRNLVHEQSALAVSALAGIGGAIAAPEATAHGSVNAILIGAGIAFATRAGASAPWWACTVTAAVAASIAGGILPVAAGILGVAIVALGFFPAAVLDYSSESVDDLVGRLNPASTVAADD